jgi:hypothetical protein
MPHRIAAGQRNVQRVLSLATVLSIVCLAVTKPF